MELISSSKNPKLRLLLDLQQKSAERRNHGLFVVEGQRELQHCIEAGYEVDTLFVCPSLYNINNVSLPECRTFELSKEVYDKVAYRGTTEGIIAEVKVRDNGLEQLARRLKSESPLIVVLESVEKPGNLGAVLRSADAAGVDAVIVCDPLTDLYNPNLIRSSIGALFTVPVATCTSEECIAFLKSNKIQILTAQLQDSELYYDTPMDGPTALVMGTESTGLTTQWREAADAHIRIPMLGCLDSLNVSVSAAILMFEAVRQRGYASKT
ncbi:MAG: RNA methyltransferase [Bacteroidaceae bacterium]|nr:RNA methyltransferase [Bacteroidaceae bacterium]